MPWEFWTWRFANTAVNVKSLSLPSKQSPGWALGSSETHQGWDISKPWHVCSHRSIALEIIPLLRRTLVAEVDRAYENKNWKVRLSINTFLACADFWKFWTRSRLEIDRGAHVWWRYFTVYDASPLKVEAQQQDCSSTVLYDSFNAGSSTILAF